MEQVVTDTVCVVPAPTIGYPRGGGHLWEYLNWALALRDMGYRVIWLEGIDLGDGEDSTARRRRWRGADPRECVAILKARLDGYGLVDSLALFSMSGSSIPSDIAQGCLDIEAAAAAGVLLNTWHSLPEAVVRRFRKKIFVDTDPGLVQVWMTTGDIHVAAHDIYFTIGETVGTPAARFPDCGLHWHYTPTPVFLPAWPIVRSGSDAQFTTVTHWWGGTFQFRGETFSNDKSAAFLEYASLPGRTTAHLELAICLGAQFEEWRARLEPQGWTIREAWDVTSTPDDYRSYLQRSRGEFSCVKAYCPQFVNSWTSNRTVCYLASGKPAVVQYTGPSRFLPDCEGLFRFRSMDEAVRALAAIEADYERHSRAARALAEEFFDATKVVQRIFERALN
jgi:hypothetical protein